MLMIMSGLREDRNSGPCISKDAWHEALLKEDFTGIDMAIQDNEQHGMTTLMISQARDVYKSRLINVIMNEDRTSDSTIDLLHKVVSSQDFEVVHIPWDSEFTDQEAIYVVIDSGRQRLMEAPEQKQFAQVTKLLRQSSRIFWLSMPNEEGAVLGPESHLVIGLARTAHAENENLNFITLNVHRWVGRDCMALQQKIFELIKIASQDRRPQEREYTWKEGQILIPRLIPEHRYPQPVEYLKRSPRQLGCPLKLDLEQTRRADTLVFGADESLEKEELASDEIEIDVRAHAVNEWLPVPRGKIVGERFLGEVAGFVTAVGQHTSDFRPGDRVCALGGSFLSSLIRVKSKLADRIADSISLTVGASIPAAFLSAYRALICLANVKQMQNILICDVMTDVGQAGVMIAKWVGAHVFVTVGSESQRNDAVQKLSLSSDRVFNQKSRFLDQRLQEAVGTGAVRCCILTGQYRLSIEAGKWLAPFGSVITVSKSVFDQPASSNDYLQRSQNITWSEFSLCDFVKYCPDEAGSILGKIMNSIAKYELRVPDHFVSTSPLTDAPRLSEWVPERSSNGKFVLETFPGMEVSYAEPKHTTLKFDTGATYLIAGGHGDFGQRLIRLLACRGAQHIVALSRRQHSQKVEEIDGAHVYNLSCDISNFSRVQKIMSQLREMSLPPVRGMIQATVSLQVGLLFVGLTLIAELT